MLVFTIQRLVQHKEGVQRAAGGADALVVQHVLAATVRHVVLCRGDIHPKGVHHRGDIDRVVVQHGKGRSLADNVQRLLVQSGIHPLVEA